MHARNVAAITPKNGKTTSLDYGKRRARLCVDVSSRRGALARRRSRVRLHNQVGPPMFTNTTQLPVDMSYEGARVFRLFDYQQVDIAVGAHVASGYGPEENDLIRLGAADDTVNDVVQRLTAERSAIQRGLVSPYGEAAKGETRGKWAEVKLHTSAALGTMARLYGSPRSTCVGQVGSLIPRGDSGRKAPLERWPRRYDRKKRRKQRAVPSWSAARR